MIEWNGLVRLLARLGCRALPLCLLVLPSWAKTVTLTATDNRTSICLVEGDTLEVALPSGLPHPYRWELQLAKPSPLTSVRESEAPGDASGMITQTFRLNAASPGMTKLAITFQSTGTVPAGSEVQTFSVDVSIASGVPKSMVLLGAYKGRTACADCTGIETALRLYTKGKNDYTEALYISTRTYLGARDGDQSTTARGEWALLKGNAVDPDATVYELNPDQPEQAQYFLLQPGGGALTELDRQMKPIAAPAIYRLTLKRVE